jgi:hypothetical protein
MHEFATVELRHDLKTVTHAAGRSPSSQARLVLMAIEFERLRTAMPDPRKVSHEATAPSPELAAQLRAGIDRSSQAKTAMTS